MNPKILEINNLCSNYGPIKALRGINLYIEEGEIVTLIGANGAGKSTLLMTICGNPKAAEGSIIFNGDDITNLDTHQIIKRGIAQSPEGRRIFPRMSILENLKMGALTADPKDFDENLENIYKMFPVLYQRRKQRGGTLSGGEQQMLSIARALMSNPKILLLDEPSLGLAPLIVKQIFSIIRDMNEKSKITVLLVEQNAHHALHLAHRAYVMVNGVITLTGSGQELLNNPEIKSAYLEGAAH